MICEELERNDRLTERVVGNLNVEPRLPFPDAAFDAALCAVSVEYLIRPIEVFDEVARVLKPGPPFIVTFSNRWFPPKAIRIWTGLHPFERLGLVLEYFPRSQAFADLETCSHRGRPRPVEDPHSPQELESDPVFAVWGERA